MSDANELVRRYIDVWNETDAGRRRDLIEALYARDADYTDPLGVSVGRDAIDRTIAGAQEQFAGLRFSLAGPVDAHHDIARFTWHLGPEGAAEPLVIGFDVAVIQDGRIRRVHGFLDKVPA